MASKNIGLYTLESFSLDVLYTLSCAAFYLDKIWIICHQKPVRRLNQLRLACPVKIFQIPEEDSLLDKQKYYRERFTERINIFQIVNYGELANFEEISKKTPLLVMVRQRTKPEFPDWFFRSLRVNGKLISHNATFYVAPQCMLDLENEAKSN